MRAMLSVLLRTLAWVIWIPVVGFFLLNILSGERDLATLFAILLGGCLAVAPLFHYGYKLKYPSAPRERPERPAQPVPEPSPLPEAPPMPQGRAIATPPFARGLPIQPSSARPATSDRLRRFMSEGAERIENENGQP